MALRKITLLLTFLFLIELNSSCWHRLTCQESIKSYSDLELPTLIIQKIDWNGNVIKLNGSNPNSHKEVYFSDVGDWYFSIGDKFKIGDTLVKKKGEPTMRVYRKGERWSFTYVCKKNQNGNDTVHSENMKF